MKSRWKTFFLYASIVLFGVGFALVLTETIRAKNTGFETKTLWDWMELLIIPIALAVGAFFLNRSERTTERKIAKDRQQGLLFQSYLDKISELLLEKKLLTTNNKAVIEVARALTLSVLRELDGKRRASVIFFLRDIKLSVGEKPVISLRGADLTKTVFYEGFLSGVNLEGVDLRQARLQGALWLSAYLSGVDLRDTDLRGTVLKVVDLQDADLERANLIGVDITNSNLVGANLKDAKVSSDQLAKAYSLKGATMPDGTIHE